MKTKFVIISEIFEGRSLEEGFEYFEKYYEDYGWTLNRDTQEVFMIVDKEINLNIGDCIFIEEFREVTWRCYYLQDDLIEYGITMP